MRVCCSSCFRCKLTLGWVMCNALAAFPKCLYSASVTNVFNKLISSIMSSLSCYLHHSLKMKNALPSLPSVRNERDRESHLWFEIPDTSFLGSGMAPRNRGNVRFVTFDYKVLQSHRFPLQGIRHPVIPYSEERA
ncbi:hypothetical protein VCR31J2_1270246 [Vibrio coralliirubri]|uniref:Uncharacterized protein n=1 Tax=Vibrio coralliirubri TaxID=1516159 RepID=A0AA86X9F2_9VIBR|nr:hypothetical protein VCR31J2_1270246 [Vibrio coralliirubri]